MSAAAADVCWICKDPATTREHRIKRSDLLAIFGKPSQDRPLFLHSQNRTNYKIHGLGSDALKLPSRICEHCNTARTQPHDRAWELLSAALRGRVPKIEVGSVVRGNRVFPNHTWCNMKGVQLYFTKLFGCMIAEGNIPIPLDSFSRAIVGNTYHPNIYLKFGCFRSDDADLMVGTSHVVVSAKHKGAEPEVGGFFYEMQGIGVLIAYAKKPVWNATDGAWNPRRSTNKLTFFDHSRTE